MPRYETPLSGKRVLVVEDRYVIAADMCDEVSRMGGEVVGPSASVIRACELLAVETVEFALLDVNLDGTPVFPVAEMLERRGVPFIFLTGYDDFILPDEWRDRPRLSKPVSSRRLQDEVVKVLSGSALGEVASADRP